MNSTVHPPRRTPPPAIPRRPPRRSAQDASGGACFPLVGNLTIHVRRLTAGNLTAWFRYQGALKSAVHLWEVVQIVYGDNASRVLCVVKEGTDGGDITMLWVPEPGDPRTAQIRLSVERINAALRSLSEHAPTLY